MKLCAQTRFEPSNPTQQSGTQADDSKVLRAHLTTHLPLGGPCHNEDWVSSRPDLELKLDAHRWFQSRNPTQQQRTQADDSKVLRAHLTTHLPLGGPCHNEDWVSSRPDLELKLDAHRWFQSRNPTQQQRTQADDSKVLQAHMTTPCPPTDLAITMVAQVPGPNLS